MAVNKVEINGQIAIDLTQDTVTPETLNKGVTAHSASGEKITGTAEEDLSLGMSSVAVGDFIRVKSVDINGKPTSWEPVQAEGVETVDVDLLPAVTTEDNGKVLQVMEGVWQAKDLPTGKTWELINEITLSEDAMSVVFDKDKSGAAFALQKFAVVGRTKGSSASNTTGGTICINTANTPDDTYSIVLPTYNHSALKGDQLRDWHAVAESIAGKGWRWYLTEADNVGRTNKIAIGAALTKVSIKIPKAATYIALWSRTSGSAFAAGSKIELYGVRA